MFFGQVAKRCLALMACWLFYPGKKENQEDHKVVVTERSGKTSSRLNFHMERVPTYRAEVFPLICQRFASHPP